MTIAPLKDSIPDAELVMRRNQESLWRKREGKQEFVTIDAKGNVDYPLLVGERVLYDWPERLSKSFRMMVRATLVCHDAENHGQAPDVVSVVNQRNV